MRTQKNIKHEFQVLWILGLLLCCQTACANESRGTHPNLNRDQQAGTEYQYDKNFVERLTQDTKQKVAQDQCFHRSESPETDCRQEYVEISFQQGRFNMQDSTEEPVLLTEQDLDLFLATTRYRHRFKNLYKVEKGRIVEADPKVKLPATVYDLMQQLSDGPFIPAHALAEVYEVLEETYPDSSGKYLNHNTAIQEILMEYNPQTPMVGLMDFGRLETLFDTAVICGPESVRKKQRHIKERTQIFAKDLKDVLERENIKYINLSFGISHKSLSSDISNLCKGRRTFYYDELMNLVLENLEAAFEVLHETDGVISVQASPYQSWDDGPFDCQKNYSMRIIAGAYNQPKGGAVIVPSQGRNNARTQVERVGKCADSYVDFNLDLESRKDQPETLMASFGMGFGMGRIGRKSSISTSNATPLVLSHVIYLRQRDEFRNRNLDAALVRDLKSKMMAPECWNKTECKFSDPLLKRELRVFELKYW